MQNRSFVAPQPQIPVHKLATKQKVSNPELAAVLSKLHLLDNTELQEVRNKASALLLLAAPAAKTSTPNKYSGWLKDGLVHVLRTRGLMRGDYLPMDGKQERTLQETEAELLVMVRRELTATEKTALGRVAVTALANRAARYKPISPRTLLQDIPHIKEALDAAFPDYITAGLIDIIINTRV